MTASQRFAAELVATLAGLGATNFFLAPGARSQALAIAAGQLAKSKTINLTVRIDERSLGFTALGAALSSGTPSVLITTSGTAVANLHPAVLEAHHAGVPMILLTADRPASLRGKGANQTTLQVGMFGNAVRLELDLNAEANPVWAAQEAMSHALQGRPGPVQLNLQFSEPLSSLTPNAEEFYRVQTLELNQPSRTSANVEISKRAVVVAGAGGQAAYQFAKLAGVPLFAEPSSGARQPGAVVNYLAHPELLDQVEQMIVFGKPTLSRPIVKLASRAQLIVCTSSYETFDVFDRASVVADELVPIGQGDPEWLSAFDFPAETGPRAELVSAVWDATAPGEALLFGASELIRVADKTVMPKAIDVFSNRGLSGIDGTTSTAIGIALSGKKTRALIGDLTLLHDVGGLNTSGLGELDVQLIVGNDNGGQIFTHLEMAELVSEKDFDLLFRTPQSVNLESLANAYGWKYFKASTPEELKPILGLDGFVLVDYSL